MRRCFLFLIIFVAIFNIAVLPVFAQDEQPLEVDYPFIPDSDVVAPETTATRLTRYVEYIFYLLIWASGLLALLALIYSGIKYLTSAGNPDKLRDAKDRIISALLGLAIVVGSYIILWQINPMFLRFELPTLMPMINSISPGVYACKEMPLYEGRAPLDVWVLEQMYYTEDLPVFMTEEVTQSINRLTPQFAAQGLELMSISDEKNLDIRRAIKEKINKLLDYINEKCYKIETKGKIREDFNNKIESIWFIPEVIYSTAEDGSLNLAGLNPYSAAVFDDDDFTGIGDIFFDHVWPATSLGPVFVFPTIQVSSIKPFKFIFINEDGAVEEPISWRVRLYVEKNYNAGFMMNLEPYLDISPLPPFEKNPLFPYGYGDFADEQIMPMPILEPEYGIYLPPKSIKIDGETLVVLYKGALDATIEEEITYDIVPTILKKVGSSWKKIERDEIEPEDIIQKGYYFQIFFENDNNLEDDYNIVDWVFCSEYESGGDETQPCGWLMPGLGPQGQIRFTPSNQCCAMADADAILILAGIKPL